MKNIFINYRRQDSQAYAGRLSDLLAARLKDTTIFMDVDGILPGEDFVQKIGGQLSDCSVFVPVIGPRWSNVRRGWRRRLFLPNDFVRLEILAALKRPIPIIPVLVGGASMPPTGSLPKSIAALSARNAMRLTDDRFREDVASLAEIISANLADPLALDADAIAAERTRVAGILETEINDVLRRQKRRMAGFVAFVVLILLVIGGIWGALRFRKPEPRFAEVVLTPDPTTFKIVHPNDAREYQVRSSPGHDLRPQNFPQSRGGPEPVLTLSEVLGSRGPETVAAIEKSGQIVFHAVGSTGNANGLAMMEAVADAMVKDFSPQSGHAKPSFLFNLGDLILQFGEARYYYDQFYAPYRNYPAPIIAIPGNHDGVVALGTATRTLDAFLVNFCAESFHKTPDALGLNRTAQIQPGVYFTFAAPFVRIIALYSNVMEQQGHISSENGSVPELSDAQLNFLEAALTRVKTDGFRGAVIIAVHHNVFVAQNERTVQSPGMLADLDAVSKKTGVWPHIVLSGHAHNYQVVARRIGSMTIPYVIAGTGGSHVARLRLATVPTTLPVDKESLELRDFDDRDLGYLRITVDRKRLRVEFQTTSVEGGPPPVNGKSFTVDLQTRTLSP